MTLVRTYIELVSLANTNLDGKHDLESFQGLVDMFFAIARNVDQLPSKTESQFNVQLFLDLLELSVGHNILDRVRLVIFIEVIPDFDDEVLFQGTGAAV